MRKAIQRPEDEMYERGRDSRHGWLIVGVLAVSVTVSYGVLTYSFGVVLIPMERELGFSRLELTGAFSVALGVLAIAGVPAGIALDTYSPRILLASGAALGALLVVAWSQVETLVQLYLVFAGIGLAMAAVLYNSVFAVATRWFQRRQREAITAISFAGAFASLIFAPLAGKLTVEFGWRTALIILAAVLAVVTVPLNCVVSVPKSRRPAGHGPKTIGSRRFLAVRSGRFWWMALAFALGSFCWSAVVVQLVPLLLDEGRSIEFATLALGILGVSQLPGRLSFALLASIISDARLPLATFGLAFVGLTLLALDRSELSVLSFAVLFGMSAGLLTVLSASAPAELFPRDVYGTVSGMLYACSNAARAVAPFASAAIALLNGKYTTLLATLAVLSALAAAVGASAFKRPIVTESVGTTGRRDD